jgi:hypothetical protein
MKNDDQLNLHVYMNHHQPILSSTNGNVDPAVTVTLQTTVAVKIVIIPIIGNAPGAL